MKTLITRIKRLALALCFVTPLVSWAAMEFTDPTYQPWNGVFGAAAWRSDGGNFEVSKVADIAADGTIGDAYAMKWDTAVATSGRRFCSACTSSSWYPGYTPPGMLLVYDQTGKTAAANATFSPLSFCGMWVKALADETTPYSVTGSGNRITEFGVAGVSSYFKFDKSFTVNRTGTTTFLGDATVEIAQDATFTAQANSSHVVEVDSAATLKLEGSGTLAVTTMTVNGTLDLSAETVPTISGNVTLAGTIVLPEGTEVSQESPFKVCTGTLSSGNVFVKIGDAEAVEKSFTAENGAITSFGDPIYIFTENYPTAVPAGKTYTFIGGDTADNTVVVDALNVYGTLKTQGYFSFTNYKSNGSTLDVESGSLTLSPGNNWFNGTLTVEAGATFVNGMTDAVQYGGTFTANIYGTLTMNATRWSLGSNNTLNFYEGCTVTGSGDGGNGTFDWIENATATLNVYGDVSLAAPIRVRSTATVNVNVDSGDQAGLTLAGTVGAGKIVKKGAGLLKFTTNPPYAITVENGAFTFAVDATPTITYSAKPGAGTSMSMWYATQSTWKGTVVLGVLSAPAALPLDAYGNANSKIVLTGTTGNCYLNGTTTVAAEVVVGTDENSVVEFNNGNSDQVGTFSKVSGPGTLKLVGWSGCRAATYVLSTLDNFEGLAIANNITRNEGGTFTVRFGNIVTTRTTDPGDCVLPIANTAVDNATGTVVYDLANATVNGTALDLESKADGIYVVVPTVTITVPVVPNANVTVTVGEETIGTAAGDYAVEPGSEVVVTYAAASGYRLPDGVASVYNVTADADKAVVVSEQLVPELLVAKVRNTSTNQYDEYTSLAAAVAAAADENHNPMVTLMANVDEAEVTIGSFVMLIGNYTISSDVTIADGGQLQIQQVTLAGTLTIEDGGVYATGTGTLGTLVAEDGAIIQLSTLSTDSAPLTITTLTVEGNLTVVSSYAGAVRGTTYKAISYVTANATIAQGATVAGVNEWSADTTVDGDNTIITLEITAVAKVGDEYFDDAQDAVDAAVASGNPVEFIISDPGTVTLGAGETLSVKGVNIPTVELEDGLTTPPYSLGTTPYSEVTGLTIYTVVKEVSVVPASVVISYNTYAELSVIGYDEGATFGWTMYTNNVACKSTVGPVKISSGKTKATVKVYSETMAFDNVVAKVAITNGEEVIEREATITVADVAAKIGETEYTKAELNDAIAAAIESGDVLEHYLSVSTTISKGQTLKTKKLAERNGSATVKAAASTVEGEAWTVAKSEEDGVITWSVATETPYFEFTSTDSQTVEYLASPKNAAGVNKLLSDVTLTKQFSVTKDGVVLDLNGHALTSTYSSTSAGAIYVNVISPAPAALTVKDSVGGGSIAAASAHSVFTLGSNGQLTVEGGSFTGKHIVYATKTTSEATITGGTFAATDAGFTLNMLDSARGTITVTGGTFTGFNPANNSAEGAGTNFVPNGYVSTETSTGVWTVAEYVPPSGLDPASDTPAVPSTAATEEAAEAEAKANIVAPSGVEKATYAEYFKYDVTGDSGAYTVTIVGFADQVVEDTGDDALDALQAAVADTEVTEFTVAVPAGLYYKVETFGTLGGAPVDSKSGLSNGTTEAVDKPNGTTQGFIKVQLSTKAIN